MREFKFRVYDPSIKAMLTPSCIGEFGGVYIDDRDFEDGNNCGLELMQYTGIKDKNGKYIFEGDLVRKYKYSNENSDGHIYEVFYANVRCAFAIRSNQGKYWSYDDIVKSKWNGEYHTVNPEGDADESLEIIGNIYESPELLTP